MKQFSYLFSDDIDSTYWLARKNYLKSNIDLVIEQGSSNKDILLIMKELLDDIKINTSLTEYIDEVIDG